MMVSSEHGNKSFDSIKGGKFVFYKSGEGSQALIIRDVDPGTCYGD